MNLGKMFLAVLFALVSLSILTETTFAQTVPDKISNTSWTHDNVFDGHSPCGLEYEEFESEQIKITFKEGNTVFLDAPGKKWEGTYKQNGKNIKAEFKYYKLLGKTDKIKEKLEFEGKYGLSQGDKISLWIKLSSEIECFEKDLYFHFVK